MNPGKILISTLCFLLCSAASGWSQTGRVKEGKPPIPIVTIGKVAQAPTIDGKVDDACWKLAKPLRGFLTQPGYLPTKFQTTAWLAYDQACLYLAVECAEPEPEKIKCAATHDRGVWGEDSVELFLGTEGLTKSYYHIISNASGTLYDSSSYEQTEDLRWESQAEVKTSIGSKAWSLEMRVPFSTLGKTPVVGQEWSLNLTRNRYVPGAERNSAWSCTQGSFHNWWRFGLLRFSEVPPPYLEVTSIGEAFWGANAMDVLVTNPAPVQQSIDLEIATLTSSVTPCTEFKSAGMLPGEKMPFNLGYTLMNGQEEYLIAKLYDATTNTILCQDIFPLIFDPPSNLGLLGMSAVGLGSIFMFERRETATTQEAVRITGEAQKIIGEFSMTATNCFQSNKTMDRNQWTEIHNSAAQLQKIIDNLSYFISTKNPWLNVASNELPSDSPELKEINLTAFVDEYESTDFMISNFSGMELPLRILTSDFQSAATPDVDGVSQSFSMPASHLVLRNVLFHRLRDGRMVADPMPVTNQACLLNLPVIQTAQVWLTVDTFGFRPGKYVCPITVKPLNSPLPTKTIQLNLTVLPVRLPKEMPIVTYTWDYAPSKGYVKDLIDHRVNHLLVSTYECLPECDADGNVLKIDYSKHDTNLLMKRQFGNKIVYSYGVVLGFDMYVASKHKWAFMSEPWKKAFRAWFTDWISHIKRLGLDYSDFSMQIWDEVTGPKVDQIVQIGPFLRELDPAVRWIMDGLQNLEEVKKMDPYVDIWIPHMPNLTDSAGKDELLAFYKSTGKPIWTYTCRTQMAGQPTLEYYRLKPWQAWKLGMDGVAFWAYNSWRGDSWDDFDATGEEGYSDNGVVYLGTQDPITSRRWEAWREGLEDYDYLYLCKKACDEAEVSGRKVQADKVRPQMDAIVDDMLKNPEDVTRIDKARAELASAIIGLHQTRESFMKTPPMINFVGAETQVVWECVHPVSVEVAFRQKYASTWQRASFAEPAASGQISLGGVRPGLKYEYFLLISDELGQLESTPIKEFMGPGRE